MRRFRTQQLNGLGQACKSAWLRTYGIRIGCRYFEVSILKDGRKGFLGKIYFTAGTVYPGW